MSAEFQQVIVQAVAQVYHADQMFVLVQGEILGRGNFPGGCRLRSRIRADICKPCVKIVVLIESAGAVHPGVNGEKLLPIGHDLLPVGCFRLAEMKLLGRRFPGDEEIRLLHQAVAVAVKVEHTLAAKWETTGCIALGIELDELELIAREIGDEGDIMFLRHGVVDGDEELVFDPFDGELVIFVGVFRLGNVLRGQSDAAAADDGLSGGMQNIAADRADVELGAQEVGGTVPVDDRFALHQLQDRYPQRGGQRLKEGDVGQTFCRLPLGDGFGTDGQNVRQLGLGHVFRFAQLPDGAAGDISIHRMRLAF